MLAPIESGNHQVPIGLIPQIPEFSSGARSFKKIDAVADMRVLSLSVRKGVQAVGLSDSSVGRSHFFRFRHRLSTKSGERGRFGGANFVGVFVVTLSFLNLSRKTVKNVVFGRATP